MHDRDISRTLDLYMADTRTIFFLGKPGCGKGTQAKMLSERTGWDIIASGDQFREIATEDSPVGRKVRAEIDAGLLAPHWFAMYLYQKALFSIAEDASVIFDGFNRKPEEAQLVIDSLAWLGRPFTVINLVISDELVHERIQVRSKDQHRADDNSVNTRIEEYNMYTKPALELFRAAGELVDIDGAQGKEKIAKDIVTALNLS